MVSPILNLNESEMDNFARRIVLYLCTIEDQSKFFRDLARGKAAYEHAYTRYQSTHEAAPPGSVTYQYGSPELKEYIEQREIRFQKIPKTLEDRLDIQSAAFSAYSVTMTSMKRSCTESTAIECLSRRAQLWHATRIRKTSSSISWIDATNFVVSAGTNALGPQVSAPIPDIQRVFATKLGNPPRQLTLAEIKEFSSSGAAYKKHFILNPNMPDLLEYTVSRFSYYEDMWHFRVVFKDCGDDAMDTPQEEMENLLKDSVYFP